MLICKSGSLEDPNRIEHYLLAFAETLLLRPEIFAFVLVDGSLSNLNDRSEMNVPSDPESIRALKL